MGMLIRNNWGSSSGSNGFNLTAETHFALNTGNRRPDQRTFEVIPKPLGYVIGEQLRELFDFIWARLPSFSLPGAAAHSVPSCLEGSCGTADPCEIPEGSYRDSCMRPKVTFDPDRNACSLVTRCATFFEDMIHQFNEFIFPANSHPILVNHNGTLIPLEKSLSVAEANQELKKLKESGKESLKEVDEVIGRLEAGNVIMLDQEGQLVVVPSDDMSSWGSGYNQEAVQAFLPLAKSTGGIMGLSPSSKDLPFVFERISGHILQTASKKPVDIALVLDTTASMHDDIEQVKENLIQFVKQVKAEGENIRIALMQYRDSVDTFLSHIDIDLTSDLSKIEKALREIQVKGGGDTPEAALDALLVAKDKLSWTKERKNRFVILISDAPPHETTVDGLHNGVSVSNQYRKEGIEIAVYPIVVSTFN